MLFDVVMVVCCLLFDVVCCSVVRVVGCRCCCLVSVLVSFLVVCRCLLY